MTGTATPTRDRLEQALRLYRRRIDRCRTENQRNRVHIMVENYMTPAEVRQFAAALAGDPADSPSRQWIVRLAGRLPVNKARPAEFARKGLCKGATRYTNGDASTPQKTLIVGVSGHFHRLMVPTPWLLDCLNPALYDVVILRDFSRIYYSSGIPGLGRDFAAAIAGLGRRIDPRAYRNTIAVGTSGGGLAALLAAALLDFDKAIAIGAQDFAHVAGKLKAFAATDDPYTAFLASPRERRWPELLLAYGADNRGDAASAAAIHAILPSELRPVKRCGEHAVLAWQHERGTLPAYLAKLLGQGLESREMIALAGMALNAPSTINLSPIAR